MQTYPPHNPARHRTCDGLGQPDITNGDRAAQAEAAFIGGDAPGEDSDYSDLITNLLHHAHREGHDPAEILRSAESNFRNEADHLQPVTPQRVIV